MARVIVAADSSEPKQRIGHVALFYLYYMGLLELPKGSGKTFRNRDGKGFSIWRDDTCFALDCWHGHDSWVHNHQPWEGVKFLGPHAKDFQRRLKKGGKHGNQKRSA